MNGNEWCDGLYGLCVIDRKNDTPAGTINGEMKCLQAKFNCQENKQENKKLFRNLKSSFTVQMTSHNKLD